MQQDRPGTTVDIRAGRPGVRDGVPFEPRSFEGREWRAALLVVVCLLVPIYASTASWDTLQSNDPRSAALAGWTLAATGSLAFDDRWEPEVTSWPAEGRDGRFYSNRFPGVIFLSSAAYVGPVAIGLVPADPVEHPYEVPIWPATLVAILVAAVAVLLTYRVFREVAVPRQAALLAGVTVAIGSPVWSVSADALWTHGATHALLMGALLTLLRGSTAGGMILCMAAVTFRPHLVVAVGVLAFLERSWPRRVAVGAGGVAGLGLVALYSLIVFGQPLPAAGYRVGHVLEVLPLSSPGSFTANVRDWLFDAHRGVVLFVPALLLAIPKGRAAWRSAPRWVRISAVAGLAYAVAQVGLMRASGGTFFFGHRTTIEALVLASPFLLLAVHRLWTEVRVARVGIASLIGFSIVTHGFGAWIGMPREAREDMREFQAETRPDRVASVDLSAPPGIDSRGDPSHPTAFHLAKELQNPR